jgi:transposase
VRLWLAQRPRFHIHYTPAFASWLNQVERWFGLITQQAIRRGSFRSVRDLITRIQHFVEHYNRRCRPFTWTATADSKSSGNLLDYVHLFLGQNTSRILLSAPAWFKMARPYGDDLRRKFLSAYDEGEETLEELADRFVVSLGWAKKISAQRNRNGRAERVPHQAGRKCRAGVDAQRQVMDWVAAKPDLTLAQLQSRLAAEAGISLSLGRIWHLLKKLGLRLKKSRSTPPSATPKRTANAAQSLPHTSSRSRRNG